MVVGPGTAGSAIPPYLEERLGLRIESWEWRGGLGRSTMILGIGIDIIEVARIQSSYEKFGERFLSRILRPEEISYCLSHRSPGPFLAARFAAKEAVSKAFGTGIGAELGWQDIEVVRKGTGEPTIMLHDRGEALLRARGGREVLVSLSHTQVHATAMAILEG